MDLVVVSKKMEYRSARALGIDFANAEPAGRHEWERSSQHTGIRECLGRLGVAEGPREIRKDSEPNDGCPRHHASEGSPS